MLGSSIQMAQVDELNVVSMVVTNDGTVTTFLGLAGDYLRIGDAAATSHALASEDDLMVTGKLEVDGIAEFDGALRARSELKLYDDVLANFGTTNDGGIKYQTNDADAKHLVFYIDESDDSGNNVPVFAFMEHTGATADLGLFDTFTEPLVCVVDNDKDSWCGISFSADDVPILSTNKTGANGIVLTNPKNAAASALSGTQLDVEMDIGGTPYHFTVFPTKA